MYIMEHKRQQYCRKYTRVNMCGDKSQFPRGRTRFVFYTEHQIDIKSIETTRTRSNKQQQLSHFYDTCGRHSFIAPHKTKRRGNTQKTNLENETICHVRIEKNKHPIIISTPHATQTIRTSIEPLERHSFGSLRRKNMCYVCDITPLALSLCFVVRYEICMQHLCVSVYLWDRVFVTCGHNAAATNHILCEARPPPPATNH